LGRGTSWRGFCGRIALLRARIDLTRRLFGLRVIVGKIVVSLIGLLGGLTIGREGPTVHIGAAMMAEVRRFYPHRNAQLERRLLLAGAAAGLSAAFNTPLAGIIFAIEEARARLREPHERHHDHRGGVLGPDFTRTRR
jgi:H+/Cl- antiporter ClcA